MFYMVSTFVLIWKICQTVHQCKFNGFMSLEIIKICYSKAQALQFPGHQVS